MLTSVKSPNRTSKIAISSILRSRRVAMARENSFDAHLREELLPFEEPLLRLDLALLEDLAARLRRFDVLRAVLFVTGEPPVGRL
jgi:hypothetical protein